MINTTRIALLAVLTLVGGTAIAQTPANLPAEAILFKNVKVFNGEDDARADLDVLVVGNKIHKVEADIPETGTWAVKPGTGDGTRVSAPAGGDYSGGYRFLVQSESGETETVDVKATVIDGGGRTLMPGLIDAHTHLNMQFGGHGTDRGIQGMQNLTWEEIGALAYESAREFLPAGVTTVRDLCGMSQGLRKHIDSGTLEGPRIYTSGACLGQSSGHGDWRWDPAVLRDDGSKSNLELLGITKLTDGADEVLKASRNNLAGGADFVKMMSGGGVTSERDPIESVQGTIEELSAMATATSQFGTISAVHAYHDESVQNALKAGVMSIEHGNLMAKPETFQMVKDADAWVVPAMAAFAEDIFEHAYYGNPDLPAYGKVKKIIVNGDNWIKLANKYEINLGFGSDSIITTKDGWRQTRDFQITQWGRSFGNFRTLKAMTSDNGRLMALTGDMNPYPGAKLGVIEEGAFADIILVDGNPLEDLALVGASAEMFGDSRPTPSVDTIPLVMKNGVIYKNTLK